LLSNSFLAISPFNPAKAINMKCVKAFAIVVDRKFIAERLENAVFVLMEKSGESFVIGQ